MEPLSAGGTLCDSIPLIAIVCLCATLCLFVAIVSVASAFRLANFRPERLMHGQRRRVGGSDGAKAAPMEKSLIAVGFTYL